MSIFSAIGHAFEHVVKDVEHGVEGAAKGFLTGGPLGAVTGGLAGSGVFSAIGDVAKDLEHGAEDIAKGVEHGVEGVARELEHGFEGLATGFLRGGPLAALEGGVAGLLGGLDQPANNQPYAAPYNQQPSNLYNPAATPLNPYSPAMPGGNLGSPNSAGALLQQAEADLSQIRSLIYGGGSGPGTTSIGDNSGLGGLHPFQNRSPFGDQGGAPVPFTPTQTNQKAQLIADAQFIAQNSANPAEASQVAQAQNDIQYREANIISNASLISHSNEPASVLQGAMNQIVSDASIGNEANLVGDLNQLSSDIRSGQSPEGRQIYSA